MHSRFYFNAPILAVLANAARLAGAALVARRWLATCVAAYPMVQSAACAYLVVLRRYELEKRRTDLRPKQRGCRRW